MARRPDAVVLAAGRSSRMGGQPKGLVRVRGRLWLEVQLEAIARAGVDRIVVVLGRDRDLYLEALPDLASRVVLVVNPDPDRGPFSSLQCGLAALVGDAPSFVLPVDVPAAAPAAWRALEVALARPGDPEAAVPEGGGHPVLLSPALATRLLGAPGGGRLDHELAAARVERAPIDDPSVRLNLNRPEDWGKLEEGG